MLKNCCGCIELKSGCLIIGLLQLISVIITIIISLIMLVIGGAVMILDDEPSINDSNKDDTQQLVIIAAIVLPFSIISLVHCFVLLIGLHKDKPGHLKVYLINSVIFLVIWCILYLVEAALYRNVIMIVTGLISILLNIYFNFVIKSQYYAMKSSRGRPANNVA